MAIPNDFTVALVDWSNEDDRNACCAVRDQVFVIEQQVAREDDRDAFDERARHVLARDLQGNAIGTGRLAGDAMIGRLAVMKDWRGRQVGAVLLQTLLEQARALAYPAVALHAQIDAAAFYERVGFERDGEEFIECGIRHVNMRKELAPLAAPERPGPPARPQVRSVVVESREQAATETLALIGAARHELCIYSRDLDAPLFDSEAALDALKQLAIGGRASIRIIVQEPQPAQRRGHRLVGLAQRLTSVFALRMPVQETDLQYPSAFVLNDTYGFYFRALGNRYDGEAINHAPGRHAQLLELFNQVWERSEACPELRQLSI